MSVLEKVQESGWIIILVCLWVQNRKKNWGLEGLAFPFNFLVGWEGAGGVAEAKAGPGSFPFVFYLHSTQ